MYVASRSLEDVGKTTRLDAVARETLWAVLGNGYTYIKQSIINVCYGIHKLSPVQRGR